MNNIFNLGLGLGIVFIFLGGFLAVLHKKLGTIIYQQGKSGRKRFVSGFWVKICEKRTQTFYLFGGPVFLILGMLIVIFNI